MKQDFYKTDLGIVVKDNDSIRLKSTYTKKEISEDDFNKSNPVKINKNTYLQELNEWFKNNNHEWEYNGTKYKKLDNFEMSKYGVQNYNSLDDIPYHDVSCFKCMVVLYHGKLYYTFIQGNYFPQMQLINFFTKEFSGKWTNIKNLAPVFNCDTKKIV